MKRVLIVVAALVILVSAGSLASAALWTDTFNPTDFLISSSFGYTHNLGNDPGYTPGDLVTSYGVNIFLYDDRDSSWELAFVDLPGLLSDGFYDFTKTNNTFGWSITGLITLNTTGLLDVSINSWVGDFKFDKSILNAEGTDCTPVPEPSTLLLLGSGLLGLVGYGRRMLKK